MIEGTYNTEGHKYEGQLSIDGKNFIDSDNDQNIKNKKDSLVMNENVYD